MHVAIASTSSVVVNLPIKETTAGPRKTNTTTETTWITDERVEIKTYGAADLRLANFLEVNIRIHSIGFLLFFLASAVALIASKVSVSYVCFIISLGFGAMVLTITKEKQRRAIK